VLFSSVISLANKMCVRVHVCLCVCYGDNATLIYSEAWVVSRVGGRDWKETQVLQETPKTHLSLSWQRGNTAVIFYY
jgi:hypothetical protein